MRNLILAIVAFALALPVAGCSPRKLPALGPANQITVITNVGPKDESMELLRSVFDRVLVTVAEEKVYALEAYTADAFGKHRNSRNLILLADLSRNDALSRRVRRVLGNKTTERIVEGAEDYFVLSNIEALGQTFVIVAAANRQSLSRVIRNRGNDLFAEVDSVVTERTRDVLYVHGEQNAMSNYLSSKYGWTLSIPKGFRVAEDEKGRLVKFVGSEPARLLFVYWEPAGKEAVDETECLRLRSRLVWSYYDEDVIEESMTSTMEAVFQGRKAVKIQGVWQNEKHVIGGPFFTFCFVERGRLYMIDCVVFAPGMDKGAFLKQLEAMALTFKDERKGS